jgi:hypothetical protein
MSDSIFIGVNNTGSTIPAYSAVYAAGNDLDPLPAAVEIALAKADSASTMPCIGVTIESIAAGGYGRVMMAGFLEDVNTSAFSVGDTIFVSATTAGGFVSTRPVGPNIGQEMGTILVDHATLGAAQIVARTATTGNIIGTDVQAWDASLDSIAGLTYASGSFIALTAADTYTVRTYAQTLTDLSGQAGAAFSFNDQGLTGVASIAGPAAALTINNAVVQDISLWAGIGSGNPSLTIYGWNTAGSDLESAELTMDDGNDEFLIQVPNSANNEGVTVSLQETNQRFRVRQNSDQVQIFHDGTDAGIHTTDGGFKLTTDEGAGVAQLKLSDGSANYVTIQTQAISSDYSLTLPTTDGDNTQVLQTNGSGVLSWVANSGAANITDIANGAKVTGATDAVSITHDNTDATFSVDDGGFIFTTSEGTNTDGVVSVVPKGTGDGTINIYQDGTNRNTILKTSDAEGVASSADFRVGLDESLRRMMIMDAGDIATDTAQAAATHPELVICDNAGNERAILGYTAGGDVKLTMDAASITGAAWMAFYSNYGATFTQGADLPSGDAFSFDSSSSRELTDTDGEQSFMILEPKINQTAATGTWNALKIKPTITTQSVLASRTTNTVNQNTLINIEADAIPVWNVCVEKVVKANNSDLFDASALTDTSDIFILPANSILMSCVMDLDTQFAGVTTLKVEVGITGVDTDAILLPGAMDLTSDAAGSNYSNHGAYWDNASGTGGMYYVDSATTLTALATSTVENLDQTSAGNVVFYFTYMTLPTTA